MGGSALGLLSRVGTGMVGLGDGQGCVMGRADFPDFRLSNAVLKMSHSLKRLSRSWSSSFYE